MASRALAVAVAVFLLPATLSAATYTVKPDGTGDFPTIQAAVNGSGNGDIIVLTDGFFNANGDHGVSFLGKAITIRSANGPSSTIINCLGDDGFIFANNEPAGAILRDVTIQSANTALMCASGYPTIRNVVVANAWIGIQVGDFSWQSQLLASPTVELTTFSNCHVATTTRDTGHLILNNSTVTQCNTAHSGVGGFISASSCTFTSNTVGAGWTNGFNTGGSFLRCSFTDHTYDAIHAAGGVGPVTVIECLFQRNHAAVFCDQNGITVTHCTFLDNSPAIFADQGTDVVKVYDSIFCGNSGAISSGMKLEIVGNTLVRNSGPIGLVGSDATGPIERNLIAFNTQGSAILCYSGAAPTLSCNDLFGNVGGNAVCGVDGGNNFSLDPLFCSADCSDFGIAGASPCAPANNACGVQIGASGPTCNPLPVLFQAVTARALEDGVQITWSIAADEAIESFAVLRDSRVVAEHLAASDRVFVDKGAKPGLSYRYTVMATTGDGDVFRSQAITVRIPAAHLELTQNQPNPFNPSTRIAFALPEAAMVDVSVYDVDGKRIATLLKGHRPAGNGTATWNGTNERGQTVGSGVYFCRLTANGEIRTVKMVLMK